jgi:hypothetical protein
VLTYGYPSRLGSSLAALEFFFLFVSVLENSEQISSLEAIDLYIEKKKWKVLPPYVKIRNKQGSICRLRGTGIGGWCCVCVLEVGV